MSNIVSSTISSFAQADGRKQVHELHVDLVGFIHDIEYLTYALDDLNANLALHAANLALSLQNNEIGNNIAQIVNLGSLASPTFVFSTQAQSLAALRMAYQSATQTQAVMMGDFLSSLTNAQLQSIFGMTSGQVTTLRSNKLTPAASTATVIRAAAGQ